MKKGKAAKKAAIAVVTAVAVGGVSVGGYYGIRQAQKPEHEYRQHYCS